MKADDRLKNIVKIGYLEHSKEQNKVEAELPPIDVDVTNYGNNPSWGQSDVYTAGFWESYLHGVKLAFGFIFKAIIFIVFAVMGLKVYNWIV